MVLDGKRVRNAARLRPILEVSTVFAALLATMLFITAASAHGGVSLAPGFIKDSGHVMGVPGEGGMVGGETIETAVPIPGLPFSDSGNTCNFTHDYEEWCPYTGSEAPDVVYAYTAREDQVLDISLCNSYYDTQIFIYANEYTPGDPYACNEDYCSGPNYPVPYLSALPALPVTGGGTYYIVIDGYGGDCGDYVLDIAALPPPPPVCPAGTPEEGEPDCYDNYVDTFNGGCQSDPPVFSYLRPNPGGATVERCGASGTYPFAGMDYRDTDWYEIEVTEPNDLAFCAIAEFPVQIVFIDATGGCIGMTPISFASADPYEEVCLNETVEPGAYWLFVSPSIFTGVECGSRYYMTLDGFTGVPSPVESTTWGRIKGSFR
jgi:hypothetical protein